MKYIMELNNMEMEVATEQRVIEYAENRLQANNNDRHDFSFDTYSMDIQQAIFVIESYGEEVKEK